MIRPLAFYVHWPFCVSKCPYCDFNSHVRASLPESRYLAALIQEIAYEKQQLEIFSQGQSYEITSIFFGGGTPSLMKPETVASILEAIKANFTLSQGCEITLEANPSSAELQKFKAFRQAGINRLSLGVQALDDKILSFLGRPHNKQDACQALEMARSSFDRISFDLIYGIYGQSLGEWETMLDQALSLADDHLSLYQLTLEPGTHFMTRATQGEKLILDEDQGAIAYQTTHDLLTQRGLFGYEVSNFAKLGAESRHNLAYWQYQDYIGVGAGAHSRIWRSTSNHAISRIRLPESWIGAIESKGAKAGISEDISLTNENCWLECLMMGLRLKTGIPESRLRGISGIGFEALHQEHLQNLIAEDWLKLSHDQEGGAWLTTTLAGRMRLDGMLAYLCP